MSTRPLLAHSAVQKSARDTGSDAIAAESEKVCARSRERPSADRDVDAVTAVLLLLGALGAEGEPVAALWRLAADAKSESGSRPEASK